MLSARLLRSAPALRPVGSRAASHGAHYNQPTGRLFGETPPPPGQKRQKEDWENIYYWGLGGAFVLAFVLKAYKPDTSLESWATGKAKEKLESEA